MRPFQTIARIIIATSVVNCAPVLPRATVEELPRLPQGAMSPPKPVVYDPEDPPERFYPEENKPAQPGLLTVTGHSTETGGPSTSTNGDSTSTNGDPSPSTKNKLMTLISDHSDGLMVGAVGTAFGGIAALEMVGIEQKDKILNKLGSTSPPSSSTSSPSSNTTSSPPSNTASSPPSTTTIRKRCNFAPFC